MATGISSHEYLIGIGDGRDHFDLPEFFDSFGDDQTFGVDCDSFIFSVMQYGGLKLKCLDGTTEVHNWPLSMAKLAVPRAEFVDDALERTRNMIASVAEGLPPDFVERCATELSTVALDAINDPILAPAVPRPMALPLFFCLGFVMLYDEREEFEHAVLESAAAHEVRAVPAAASAIVALEEAEIGSASAAQEPCMVCLEDLDERLVVRFPCSHLYHRDCATHWLETSHLCPLCRYAMPTATESST